MSADPPSVQRSFRLARQTAARLDAVAAASGETRNALADRLLSEALRIEQHPLIRFRSGAARRRHAMLAGTRLHVRDVIVTLRAHDNDAPATAGYLALTLSVVMGAIDYYAEHTAEIEADIAWAEDATRRERDRWERQQAALA